LAELNGNVLSYFLNIFSCFITYGLNEHGTTNKRFNTQTSIVCNCWFCREGLGGGGRRTQLAPRLSSPLLRSGPGDSFNHEFAVQDEGGSGSRDCDISSLSLGRSSRYSVLLLIFSPFMIRYCLPVFFTCSFCPNFPNLHKMFYPSLFSSFFPPFLFRMFTPFSGGGGFPVDTPLCTVVCPIA
jgi:hypothetical protein